MVKNVKRAILSAFERLKKIAIDHNAIMSLFFQRVFYDDGGFCMDEYRLFITTDEKNITFARAEDMESLLRIANANIH